MASFALPCSAYTAAILLGGEGNRKLGKASAQQGRGTRGGGRCKPGQGRMVEQGKARAQDKGAREVSIARNFTNRKTIDI